MIKRINNKNETLYYEYAGWINNFKRPLIDSEEIENNPDLQYALNDWKENMEAFPQECKVKAQTISNALKALEDYIGVYHTRDDKYLFYFGEYLQGIHVFKLIVSNEDEI